MALLKIQNMMDIKEVFASMVYIFFNKKTSGSGSNNKIKQNQRPLDLATRQLAEELHKPIIRKF